MNRRRNELEHQASELVRQILREPDRPTREQLINQHHGLRVKIEAMRKVWIPASEDRVLDAAD